MNTPLTRLANFHSEKRIKVMNTKPKTALEMLEAEIEQASFVQSENRADIVRQLLQPAVRLLYDRAEEIEALTEDADELRARMTQLQKQLDEAIAGLRKVRRSMGEE